MSDRLPDILAIVRKHMPSVPESTWKQIEKEIRVNMGAERHYIARFPKRWRLEALSVATSDNRQTSRQLGVSVRYVQQLRHLVDIGGSEDDQ